MRRSSIKPSLIGEAGNDLTIQAGDEVTIRAGDEAGDEVTVQAGDEVIDITEPDPPPPADNLSSCDRFCERVEGCLYPACPNLSMIPPDDFCEGWCSGGARAGEWLDQSADLSCDLFNQRIFGFSPEVRALCQEEDEDQCEEICAFGELCGLVSDSCPQNCERLDFGGRLCFSGATELGDCQRYIQCLRGGDDGGGRGDRRPDEEELCAELCDREASCVFNACAPGTLTERVISECQVECEANISSEMIMSRYAQTCEEVVENIRANDSEVNARCDQDEASACELLCEDQVSSCLNIDQETCLANCDSWDQANYICLAEAGDCEEVQGCFIDADEQDRCRRSCDYLQICLEEACPQHLRSRGRLLGRRGGRRGRDGQR